MEPEGRPSCDSCGAPLPGPDAPCSECTRTAIGGADGDDTSLTQAATLGLDDPDADPSRLTGLKRISHYRLIGELGAGGMGTVFEAHDEKMNRRVALKVMSRHQAPSAKAEERFVREASIAGNLDHPHVVKVYGRGIWEELSFFSMELVAGGSLADVVASWKRSGRDDRLGLEFGTRDTVRWVLTRVIEAARGLQYAHEHGIVHRDIKPMNLLLSRESGGIKIADFGLAIAKEASRLTSAGKALGTVMYMAPEQILGKPGIDGRADTYALGVTLFELLTLDFPYAGKTKEMYVNAVLTGAVRTPRALNERVGRDLEIVIRKSLEKNSRDRYATVGEMADDLEAILEFRPIRARPPKTAERVLKWVRRRPIHAALIAVLAVGAPLVGFLTDRALEHRRLARGERIESLENEVRWLWQRDRLGELIEPVSAIIGLNPKHLRALQTRGVARVIVAEQIEEPSERQQLQSEAVVDADRILELQPEAAWAHRLKAWILREIGRPEEAAESERQAERFRPANPTADDLRFDGRLALESGRYAEAVVLLTKAIALRPGVGDLLSNRADAYERLGNVTAAIQDYRVLVALNPEDYHSTFNLGKMLTASGAVDEGEQYTRRALELAPDNPVIFEGLADLAVVRGLSAVAQGDTVAADRLFKQAESHARRALELAPEEIWSHLNLGASLMEQNRLRGSPDPALIDEAVNHYQEAARRLEGHHGRAGEREIAGALVNSCDALIQAGNLERALASCLEATRALPDEAICYYNLAGIYALMDRPDEALAALERDVELGDTDWQYLQSDAWFESLYEDAQFQALLERMK